MKNGRYWLESQEQRLKTIDELSNRISHVHAVRLVREIKRQMGWSSDNRLINIGRKLYGGYIRTELNEFPASSSLISLSARGWRANTVFNLTMNGTLEDNWSIPAMGYYFEEICETVILLRLFRNHREFVDVGANIGYYSLLAAQAGLPVVAIEAAKSNCSSIKKSARENGCGVSVQHLALSDQRGPGFLHHNTGGSGGHTLIPLDPSQFSGGERVMRETLSSVIKRHGMSNPVIKIDVEGHELQVFRGISLELIRKTRPIFLFESWRDGTDGKARQTTLFHMLRQHNYETYPILPYARGSRTLGKPGATALTGNYLALPPDYGDISSLSTSFDSRMFSYPERLDMLIKYLRWTQRHQS